MRLRAASSPARRAPIGSCGHSCETGTARWGLLGAEALPLSSITGAGAAAHLVRVTAPGRASSTSTRKRDGTDRVFFAAPQRWVVSNIAERARVSAT